ncbi:type II toxin-antitoxin system RelE/ParE family toxin [Luteibacter sp. CQ10]|uniref:type II toxin-antitoxin system RelE/ParE family toxin n=1 Tax=Luteibacter sp. CQ10 TaxID=2805821 RepID=UPI0034A40363
MRQWRSFAHAFIETPLFTRQITELLDDESYAEFQRVLAENPEAGDLIRNTGGLRKIRVAAKGRGKRGGARVIYYYFVSASHIALLMVYPKSEMDDLTEEQKKALKSVVEKWG